MTNNIAPIQTVGNEMPTVSTATDQPIGGNYDQQQGDIFVWGEHTLNELEQVINAVYKEVVYWRKKFFIAKWSCG